MRWVAAGAMLNSTSWTIVTTAQLGLGLQLAPSRDNLVQMTALMRSAAQLTAFFTLPACGALSDWVGRKPILVVRSFIVFFFSGLVALRPSCASHCRVALPVPRGGDGPGWHVDLRVPLNGPPTATDSSCH